VTGGGASAARITVVLPHYAYARSDTKDAPRIPKLTVLSIAPALAEAMRRIHDGESVSALFDQ
jgi:phosphoribosylpyrophosphate synthetase